MIRRKTSLKKHHKKLVLSAMALGVVIPSVVATVNHVDAASDVTVEDRTIPYEYRETTENLGIKWASGEEKVTIKAAITTEGKLYTWNTSPYLPKEQVLGEKFVSVTHQKGRWGAITESGELYQWGTGGSTNPTKVEGIENVTKLVISTLSSKHNFFAITEDGSLYAWGNGNTAGELGVGTTTEVTVPTKVQGLSNVKDISSAYISSSLANMVVTDNGDLYAWGSNAYGRLGFGAVDANVTTPTKLNGIANVKTVQLDNTARVLTTDGKFYVWGYNASNEAGNGNTTPVTSPRLVLSDIKDFSASSTTTLLLTNGGKVYTWGSNSYGQSGLGHKNAVSAPTLIPSLSNIKQVVAAAFASYFVTETGDVWATGENDHGEMGNNTKSSTPVVTPVKTTISNVIKVFAQNSRTQAVTSDNKVYTWGLTIGAGTNLVPTLQWDNNQSFEIENPEGVFIGVSNEGVLELSGATASGNIFGVTPAQGQIAYNVTGNLIKQPSNTVIKFFKVTDNAVNISWDEVKGAQNYKVTRNGVELFNSTETSFVDNNAVYAGVDYTYIFTFTTDIGTYTKTMVYTHGEEPDFTPLPEPEEPTPSEPITWTFDNPTGDFISTMIPEISVLGGKVVDGIKLTKVDLGSTKTITTAHGDVTFTPDGNGNTVVSMPNGLGTSTTDTTIDVQFNGTSILSVVVKPKPVINFSF